jgi:FkbH-like protein
MTAGERLQRDDLELAEVLALVEQGERELPDGTRTVRWGVAPNATLELLGLALRRQALLDGHRAAVTLGSFADPIGNLRRFAAERLDAAVLWNVFDLLLPGLEARLPLVSRSELGALCERFAGELQLALDAGQGLPRIHVALLHRLHEPASLDEAARADAVLDALNAVVRAEVARRPGLTTFSPGEAVARIGRRSAFAPRMHYRFKAPYTLGLHLEVARQLSRATRGSGAHFLKVLAVDADRTLWGGIVGEDGVEGLALSPHDYPGNVYWRVQRRLAALRRAGVLLCLCSKNEPPDVEAALGHPASALSPADFTARRVSWEDKPAMLASIAQELNLGLDAFAFLDDQAFECEAVRARLPQVRVFQVPDHLWEYPALLDQVAALFVGPGEAPGAADKAEQYRVRAMAEEERARFASQDEYLASLGLKARVVADETAAVGRIAELTQKSNQWNLTTRRYAEPEIAALMAARDAEVHSVHVADRFGDSGLTGVVVLRYAAEVVTVEACLLSCRVIGRGVEHAIWPGLLARARSRGARRIRAEYLPTAKNPQVKDFWDGLGLSRVAEEGGARRYEADLARVSPPAARHVEVHHG